MTLRELHLTQDAPWPGPAAYTERDSGFFHGRAAETTELHRLIHAEPVCVLYALSGLGKTSLLQAGVFPRLRADGWLPVRIRLDHRDLDDDGNPVPPLPAQVLDLVAQAAQARGISVPEWSLTDDTLTTAFHERGERLWGAREDEPVTPVLVFDQFEECWTQTRDRPAARARAEALLGEVAALIDWRGNGPLQPAPVRVVFSLREDQLAPLDALRPLFPSLRRARLRLLPFTAAQATEVVEIPGGGLLDDGAAEAIVSTFASRDVDRPIADPALLSIFCWRLNENRRSPERQADTITAARAIALRGEFVQQFYDAAFALLPPQQSLAARRFVETDLIDAAGYRSSAGFEHAKKKYGLGPGSLETLVDARLLHPVDRSGGHRHVELVHDRIGEEAMRQRTLREEAEAQAQAAAQTAQLRADLARARRRALILTALTLLALAAMAFALFMRQQAEEATAHATVQTARALQANSEAGLANVKTIQALMEAQASNEKTEKALADARLQKLEADKQRLVAEAATQAIDAEKTRADQSRDKALAAKKSADELIRFMQYDLRDTLGKLGRLDMMKAINDRISKYHKEHPPDTGDAISEHDKAIMFEQQGDIQKARGDFQAAMDSYEARHAIATRLARKDLGEALNALSQQDLYLSYCKIGSVQAATGDSKSALASYNRALEISKAIVDQYPDNVDMLHDLAHIYSKTGVAQEEFGDSNAAEDLFQQSHTISKRLADIDPTNPEWQSSLAFSYIKIGNILATGGDNKAAKDSYQKSLDIRTSLVKQYPSNAQFKLDLSFSYIKLGGAQAAASDDKAALASYTKCNTIRTMLVRQDSQNIQWQHDLSRSHYVLSLALEKMDAASALVHAKAALKIYEEHSALFPFNITWRDDMKESRALVSRLQAKGNK